ncbi:MAG: hypothetical protein QM817_35295 [Archangium sp.]
MSIKREELFEVHEPPAHGLTRLRARMQERKTSRVLRPVLAVAVLAAAVALVFWPREAREGVDFGPSVAALESMSGDVMGLEGTAVEAMKSSNPRVVLVRAMAAPSQLGPSP